MQCSGGDKLLSGQTCRGESVQHGNLGKTEKEWKGSEMRTRFSCLMCLCVCISNNPSVYSCDQFIDISA